MLFRSVFTFICGDGKPIAIHLSSPDKFWYNFARATGHPELIEDERFKAHDDRRRNHQLIVDVIKPEFSKRSRAEWMQVLEQADVPFAPIYTLDEVVEDPQAKHLGVVQTAVHPKRGEVKSLAYPVTLSDTTLGPVKAPAELGENNDEILAEAGYAAAEIEKLRASGALTKA